jgi:uncharacterized protein
MSAQFMSERFEMRLGPSVLKQVDAWRTNQGDLPSRAEAIRRLIDVGLAATSRSEKEVRLTDGEKLILLTLRGLFKQLNLDSEEADLDFIAEAIGGGHSWGLKWKFSGVFHDEEDSMAVVYEVVNILDMWSFLESGYEKLSKKDKGRIASDCAPFGEHVRFDGFDGNNEAGYISIAYFLIKQLNRFTKFEGRDLNAHVPTVAAHRRMLIVFEPLSRKLMGRELSALEIIAILKARLHPSKN